MAMSLIITLAMFLLLTTHHARPSSACTSSCGKLNNITYPFLVHGDDPKKCGSGFYRYEIYCENNVAMVSLRSVGKYYVEEINHADATIRLVDPAFHRQQNYSYLPLYHLFPFGADYPYSYFTSGAHYPYWYSNKRENDEIIHLSCNESVNNDGRYVNTSACVDEQYSESGGYLYNYVHIGDLSAKELRPGCTVKSTALTAEGNALRKGNNISCAHIHSTLAHGFLLQWYTGCYLFGLKVSSKGCDSIWFKILRYVSCPHLIGYLVGPHLWVSLFPLFWLLFCLISSSVLALSEIASDLFST
ncbi:hypothetical protein L6164_017721 [Bauhinia variegata]|uniref:Uncharacterized protein n=1 Tax=Bauhinia variegata TaxID=167791 RepID=A0ACB9N903_BAUVA|nr:hypothetical protein L6164_017721 [Bauhinia variegata]